MPDPSNTPYLFGENNQAEQVRLVQQEQLFFSYLRRNVSGWVRNPDGVKRILDIGCNEGHLTDALRRAFLPRQIEVYGVDRDRTALAAGERMFTKVKFWERDLTLPWPADWGMFDLIYGSLILIHIADLEHILREVYKHLAPGGLFLIHDMNAIWPTTYPSNPPYTTLAQYTWQVIEKIGNHPNVSQIVPNLLWSTGFEDVQVDDGEQYQLGGGKDGKTAAEVMLGVFRNAEPAITSRLNKSAAEIAVLHKEAWNIADNPYAVPGVMPMINIRAYKAF